MALFFSACRGVLEKSDTADIVRGDFQQQSLTA
jgi:hypothetical protein